MSFTVGPHFLTEGDNTGFMGSQMDIQERKLYDQNYIPGQYERGLSSSP